MADEVKEITVEKAPETRNPFMPREEKILTTKIPDTEKIQSLESIISSLKTSIDDLERLIDG